MRHRFALTVLAVLLAASAAIAEERRIPAPKDLGNRPVEITAARLQADSGRNIVTFDGDVIAKQEDLTLYSDRLFVEYAAASGAVEKIVAEGNVRMIQADREARAPHAVFYNLEQRIVLSGGADVTQAGNSLKGETVTVFLRENRSVVSGGEGGRVRAVIQPKGQPDGKGKGGR
ncbi:MAG: lipopolysaccharide transport periplasmic protein LptA [Deltaproteobacteria bacterium]|nr:lipopolysaccharide transport periplasmic protein LptA [Deltaproteobacteria bacterium]